MYHPVLKRLLDIALVIVSLPAVFPISVLVAAAIKVFDRGPVFYLQERVGINQSHFVLVKFRSMPVGTKVMTSDIASSVRVSRIGRLLRRTNLDELPQLFNVLRGEMSIVGPRPSLPSQVDLVARRVANGALGCRPGLTGLAQINSCEGMSDAEKAWFDGCYASQITFTQDLSILLRTFGYLARNPPTY